MRRSVQLLLCGAVIITAVALMLAFGFSKPLLINRGGGSQAVYDRRGGLLRLTLSSDEKYRLWTPLSEISPALIKATLLYEDRQFYRHPGINPLALLRGFANTYLAGGRRTGGSTITMQVARMRFAINSKTIGGKLEQILRAFELERFYSKPELLEAYFNLAPYGLNIEGVGAASRIYFGKPPKELTAQEAITLAVIPQNPTKRRPRLDGVEPEGSPLSIARRALKVRWDCADADSKASQAEPTLPLHITGPRALPFLAPHLVDQVAQSNPDTSNISTTVDPLLQQLSEKAVNAFVNSQREQGVQNASLLLIDWRTMEVRALVGSADYSDAAIQGQVDGTRAKRSPGSALKPFVYGLAIDQGLIHPQSILKDTPASFAAYDPENFDKEFLGPISATYALVRSRNLPAVQLANKLIGDGLYGFLVQADIRNLKSKEFYGLSLALGGGEVALQELVRLYAMLARGGELRPLHFVKSETIGTNEPVKNLLSPEASYLVLDMLSHNPRPGEASIEDEHRPFPVSWKTGTSFGFRDAWAVGVFGEYVLGVWVGNFDGVGNPAFVGRESAGKLFFDLVDAIRIQPGISTLTRSPAGLKLRKVKVCALSGELPGPHCDHFKETWFIPGKSPIKTCSVHRELQIDDSSGLQTCDSNPGKSHRAVFEFWPSDLLHLFAKAGIPRVTPPAFSPGCETVNAAGIAPEIISPQRGVTYQVRLPHLQGQHETVNTKSISYQTDEPIPFRAIADADTKRLFWFVNESLSGSTAPNEDLFWKPSPGSYVVRVVDDRGRADSRNLEVLVSE